MSLYSFLYSLIGEIYKLLPMYEAEQEGRDCYLNVHLQTMIREMTGATFTFPELATDPSYIEIVNTLQYLNEFEVSHDIFRSDILKSISLLKALKRRAGVTNV